MHMNVSASVPTAGTIIGETGININYWRTPG